MFRLTRRLKPNRASLAHGPRPAGVTQISRFLCRASETHRSRGPPQGASAFVGQTPALAAYGSVPSPRAALTGESPMLATTESRSVSANACHGSGDPLAAFSPNRDRRTLGYSLVLGKQRVRSLSPRPGRFANGLLVRSLGAYATRSSKV